MLYNKISVNLLTIILGIMLLTVPVGAAFNAATDTHVTANAYPNVTATPGDGSAQTSFIVNTYGVIPVYMFNFTPAAMNVQFNEGSTTESNYKSMQWPLAIGLSGSVYSFPVGGNAHSMLSNINTPRTAPSEPTVFKQASLAPYVSVNGEPYNASNPPPADAAWSFSNNYGFANIFAWFPSRTGWLSTPLTLNSYGSGDHVGALSVATSGSTMQSSNFASVQSMALPNSQDNGYGYLAITVNDGQKYYQNYPANYSIAARNMGPGAPVQGVASGNLLLSVLSSIYASGAFVENNSNSSVPQGNFGSSMQAAVGSIAQVGNFASQLQKKLSNNSYLDSVAGAASYSGIGIVPYYYQGQIIDNDATAMVQYTTLAKQSIPLIDDNYFLSCTFRQPGPNGVNGGYSTADSLYVAIINNAVVASQQAAYFIANTNSQDYINNIKNSAAGNNASAPLMLATTRSPQSVDIKRSGRILGWLFAMEKNDPGALRVMLDNFGVSGKFAAAGNDKSQLQQIKTEILALLKKNIAQFPALQVDYDALRNTNY